MAQKILIPKHGLLVTRSKNVSSFSKRTGGSLRALAGGALSKTSNAGILHKEFTRMSVNAPVPRKKKYLSF